LELTSAPEPGGGDVLENRGVAVMPFIVGLFGMVWGVLIGAMWFAADRAIAAYVGAGFGWVVGFVLGFMLAAAGDKDRPARARCPLCHNVFAAETGTCSFCGSPLQTQIFSPLTADCLKAASYPLEDVVTIYWMALSLTGGYVLVRGMDHLVGVFPSVLTVLGPWRPALIGLAGFLVFVHWMGRFLNAVRDTLPELHRIPGARYSWARKVVLGMGGLGVLAFYTVPVVTFPLLPLGLLRLGAGSVRGAFDLVTTVRMAWKYTSDFAILWLMLLLWSSALFLSVAVGAAAVYFLGGLTPNVEGASGITLSMIVSAIGAMAVGFAGSIFGLTYFRCIGLFGRYNASSLLSLASKAGPPAPETGGGGD
jgi:hypothetical protein